jgi:membrane-anchored protein YejM (alkaline phosphatase superfamily)
LVHSEDCISDVDNQVLDFATKLYRAKAMGYFSLVVFAFELAVVCASYVISDVKSIARKVLAVCYSYSALACLLTRSSLSFSCFSFGRIASMPLNCELVKVIQT